MSETNAIARPTHWDAWIKRESVAMVEALPLTVPEADMKRAHARLALALSALPEDSDIYACVPDSVVGCMAMSAMTGLFPGGHNPDVWLIPRRSKKHSGKKVLNWQISYRGHIRLCRRTPGWDVQAVPIYTDDVFSRSRSSTGGAEYRHEPIYDSLGNPDADWKALRGCLVLVRSPLGEKWDFLSKGEIAKRRAKAKDQSIWREWPVERAMGTACAWAGQREMWPTDDPSRYALGMEAAQLGAITTSLKPRASLIPSDAQAVRKPPEASALPEVVYDPETEAFEAAKEDAQQEVPV